ASFACTFCRYITFRYHPYFFTYLHYSGLRLFLNIHILLLFINRAMNNKPFKNKVVVITGASGGVGRATAWEFAKQGAKIALIARSAEQLEGAKKEVEQCGGSAITIIADVSDADALEAAAERTERELGPVDVWVNNAMNSVF